MLQTAAIPVEIFFLIEVGNRWEVMVTTKGNKQLKTHKLILAEYILS